MYLKEKLFESVFRLTVLFMYVHRVSEKNVTLFIFVIT